MSSAASLVAAADDSDGVAIAKIAACVVSFAGLRGNVVATVTDAGGGVASDVDLHPDCDGLIAGMRPGDVANLRPTSTAVDTALPA